MRTQFPHQWASAYPTDEIIDDAMQLWAEKLADLTGEQLRYGLDNMTGSFPPTVTEFKELCMGSELHKTGAYKPFERNAGNTRIQHDRDKSVGRAALEAMKNKS